MLCDSLGWVEVCVVCFCRPRVGCTFRSRCYTPSHDHPDVTLILNYTHQRAFAVFLCWWPMKQERNSRTPSAVRAPTYYIGDIVFSALVSVIKLRLRQTFLWNTPQEFLKETEQVWTEKMSYYNNNNNNYYKCCIFYTASLLWWESGTIKSAPGGFDLFEWRGNILI